MKCDECGIESGSPEIAAYEANRGIPMSWMTYYPHRLYTSRNMRTLCSPCARDLEQRIEDGTEDA